MTGVLLVRSRADIPSALHSVNDFLVRLRCGGGDSECGQILALCLKVELDNGLPLIAAADARLGILQSFSCAGVWALCWFDGELLRAANHEAERRETILRVLADYTPRLHPLPEGGPVFPVFPAGTTGDVAEHAKAMQARYPGLIGSLWFRDDQHLGIIPETL